MKNRSEANRVIQNFAVAKQNDVPISKLHSIQVKRSSLLQNFAISKQNELNYLKTSQYRSETN